MNQSKILHGRHLIIIPDAITRVLIAKDYFSTNLLVTTSILGEDPFIQHMEQEDIMELYPAVNKHHLKTIIS